MKKLSIGFIIALVAAVVLVPYLSRAKKITTSLTDINAAAVVPTATEKTDSAASLLFLYDSLGLEAKGLDKKTFELALAGYNKLKASGKIKNQKLSIVDFSQPSTKKRLYVLDIENKKVLFHTLVAHGKNSGNVMATKFSNTNESLQSSLGFYVTAEKYIGKHGLSMRMDGVEKTNSNARQRAIVVHGADYVSESFVKSTGYLGRSWGCPAVNPQLNEPIIMSLRDSLKGTGVAMVTPFDKNDAVDFDALGKLIEFIIDGGVEYVVSLGTTGETPTLTKEEKLEILDYTYQQVNGRVPVVVGIGGNNTKELIQDLEKFPLDKATAVLSASPYYNKPSQEGLYQHYKALASASPKPILLYNVPGRTGRNLNASTTLRLAALDNIGGIKEASGDLSQCMQILKDKPADFLVVSGDDNLVLPQIACGMEGVISVAANCFPKMFSDMVRACLQSDYAAARILHYKMLEGYDLLFAENNPAGVKAFLAELGVIQNNLRLPVTPLSDALYGRVRAYLKELA